VSLNAQPLQLYEQIMTKLPHLGRPLSVGFRKKMEGLGSTDLHAKSHKVHTHPPSLLNSSLADPRLGLVLCRARCRAVARPSLGGLARAHHPHLPAHPSQVATPLSAPRSG
jgi:hypothetical protein